VIYALLGLAVAMGGAAATAVVLAVKLGNERAASAKLAAKVEQFTTTATSLSQDLDRERAAHHDTKTRLEKVITDLKATNKVLEEEVAASLDPSVVHARLVRSGLFRGPEAGAPSAAGAGPAPGLRSATTAPVGTGGRGDGHT
jgi:hypothetical protein